VQFELLSFKISGTWTFDPSFRVFDLIRREVTVDEKRPTCAALIPPVFDIIDLNSTIQSKIKHISLLSMHPAANAYSSLSPSLLYLLIAERFEIETK
jgi:hypothetical protein